MNIAPGPSVSTALLVLASLPSPASAQILEAVGSRAIGMGGAFVAVANDSSATWWNPAGLPAGPFFDAAVGGAANDLDDRLPARRERAIWFTVATPPFGVSYYHLRIRDIGQPRTIGADATSREDRRVAVPERSVSAHQVGGTLVHTIVSGLHVGTTLKYVRANGSSGDVPGQDSFIVSDWFDAAEEVGLGEAHNGFDLDIGALAVRGPIRFGGVVRNLLETELGMVEIPRQARVGAAFDASEVSTRTLLVAVDADVVAYPTVSGDRRVVAAGAEGWMFERRLGLRGGARFNTAVAEEQAFAVGASVRVMSRMYVDGHVVFGGTGDEHGWGIAVRASF